MVFNCGSESPGSSWTMSWRYELTADRLGLHAIEQMRGAGRDFENTWIFERKQT